MKKPLRHHLHDYFIPHPRNNNRPNLFSALSVAALVVAILVFEAAFLVQTKFVFLKTDFLAAVLPSVLADLTNESRVAYGITPVTRDALLDTAAQQAAEDMAFKGYFAHVSPDGKTPWYWLDQAGYQYSYAGENLAVNFTDSKNVQTAWMESPTHRANIMKSQYTQVGFGTANGMYEGRETTFVVQFFATPASSEVAPVPVAVAKPSPTTQVETHTAPAQVLGSETTAGVVLAASATPAERAGWFVSLLTSPFNTFMTILTAFFSIIAIPFFIAIFMRSRFQHPNVVTGGASLLLLISATLLLSAMITGPVLLSTDSQAASVYIALPD